MVTISGRECIADVGEVIVALSNGVSRVSIETFRRDGLSYLRITGMTTDLDAATAWITGEESLGLPDPTVRELGGGWWEVEVVLRLLDD